MFLVILFQLFVHFYFEEISFVEEEDEIILEQPESEEEQLPAYVWCPRTMTLIPNPELFGEEEPTEPAYVWCPQTMTLIPNP